MNWVLTLDYRCIDLPPYKINDLCQMAVTLNFNLIATGLSQFNPNLNKKLPNVVDMSMTSKFPTKKKPSSTAVKPAILNHRKPEPIIEIMERFEAD